MGMKNLPVDDKEKTGIWQKAGWWFWLAIILGVLIRIYLVVFTQGTYDAFLWEDHGLGVHQFGLMKFYHVNPDMNHPPLIGVICCWIWDLSRMTGIPFCILFRAPFALLDGGTALLLLLIFSKSRWRFVICACYWLHPLAIIFSSFHGNTDSSIAFFLLLAVWLLSKEKTMWAAVALGASFWIKLPGLMAIPAFVFFVQGWRRRLLFLAVIGITAVSTYIPALLIDPLIVYKNIFGYHGVIIKTASGIPIFGTCVFLIPFLQGLSEQWHSMLAGPVVFLLEQSWRISLVLILIFCWLRRSCSTVLQLGATIAGIYAILYGISNYWAFQYFAWSIPFWFFARKWFLVPATIFAGGYIYSLYWMLCGNPWLLGTWDFVPHPQWPDIVILFRNLAILFFFVSACVFLIIAVREGIIRRPAKNNIKQPVRHSKRPLKT
jgi:hypothetical protein